MYAMRRAALLTIVLLLASACSSGKSTAPSPSILDLTGTWSGDFAAQGVTTRMTWNLSQSGTAVSGTALVTLPTGIVLLNGVLSGNIAGSSLTYTISVGPGAIPSQPACVGQLGGTMTASIGVTSTLSGSFNVVSTSCPVPFSSGPLTLTRR